MRELQAGPAAIQNPAVDAIAAWAGVSWKARQAMKRSSPAHVQAIEGQILQFLRQPQVRCSPGLGRVGLGGMAVWLPPRDRADTWAYSRLAAQLCQLAARALLMRLIGCHGVAASAEGVGAWRMPMPMPAPSAPCVPLCIAAGRGGR